MLDRRHCASIVAIVGLNLGVVSETGYTVLVLAAILTSLIAPQLLRAAVSGWEVPAEERERIEREKLLEASEILGSRRMLLPTRGGKNSEYAARVIAHVFDDPEVTVLGVDVVKSWSQRLFHRTHPGQPDLVGVVDALDGLRHRMVMKTATDPAAAIAREARLGYDLVLLGATEQEVDRVGVFSTVVDRVLGNIDIPSIIVRFPGPVDGTEERELPRRILVPVVASRATRAAEELAY
jgi:hypothetical protein